MAFFTLRRFVAFILFLLINMVALYITCSYKNAPISEKSITIACCTGRLGNQMFTYAALYGISTLAARQGQLQNCLAKHLVPVFNISLPVIQNLASNLQIGYPVDYSFKSDNFEIPQNANIITGSTYKNNILFWRPVASGIRREFKFQEDFVDPIQSYLRKIKGSKKEVVFVGVHVRRGDYVQEKYLKSRNLQEAGIDYFKLAFNYYRNKYKNVLFVVASDDIKWCQTNLKWTDTHFQTNSKWTENHDLALLAHCNHSIIDYGTYGWWGAYLAGGETVYFANTAPGGSKQKKYVRDTFYLEEWIGLPKRQ